MKTVKLSSRLLILIATLWLTLAYCGPLLSSLNDYQTSLIAQMGFLFVIACVYAVLFLIARAFHCLKGAIFVLFTTAAVVTYWMNQYGVVIDPDMLINALETDTSEASDLISVKLILSVFLWGVVPAIVLIWMPVKPQPWVRTTLLSLGAGCILIAVAMGVLMTQYSEYSSLFRNHRDVKYRVIPFNVISASVSVAKAKLSTPETFIALGQDATQQPDNDKTPKVMVVIVGETARADHFSSNGYPRPTTTGIEQLAQQGELISFTNATSCGTATAISVPCMFSFYQAENYDNRARSTSNVLDVLDHAGINVSWIENNSGCKNVCDRVEEITAEDYCDSDQECFDTRMLEVLKTKLANAKQDSIIVLHSMGSHGPAYYKRSPQALKKFLPECTTIELNQCSVDTIKNAYDNSLIVTDKLVTGAINTLKEAPQLDTSLMYISDHGESLGDNGVYLHGLPNWMAPDEQRHVPWILWPANAWADRPDAAATYPVNHDYLAHSLLGFFNVKTSLYQPQLDLAEQLAP